MRVALQLQELPQQWKVPAREAASCRINPGTKPARISVQVEAAGCQEQAPQRVQLSQERVPEEVLRMFPDGRLVF